MVWTHDEKTIIRSELGPALKGTGEANCPIDRAPLNVDPDYASNGLNARVDCPRCRRRTLFRSV